MLAVTPSPDKVTPQFLGVSSSVCESGGYTSSVHHGRGVQRPSPTAPTLHPVPLPPRPLGPPHWVSWSKLQALSHFLCDKETDS